MKPIRLLRSLLAVFAAWAAVAGCTLDHSPRVRLAPQVRRPAASVVLITVDGLSVDVLDELLEQGALPNVQWMIDNGVRVRDAVTGYPAITYAQLTTLLTGRHAGHHGVLGNKWFDRCSLVFRDYTTTRTYRMVDGDFLTPTLFERLNDRMTVSIQCAARRGATRIIDNWASSGIRWFFGLYDAVDSLMPTRFELISRLANRTQRWPALIHAYFPATDDVGHRHGADSPQYRRAVRVVDRQIGRIRQAVESAGMSDRTWFVLVSDHGHVPVPEQHYFDVADWLRREHHMRVDDNGFSAPSFEDRHRHYARRDAVVVAGGDRRAAIHLRGRRGWFDRPDREQIDRLLDPGDGGPAPVWMQRGVMLAATRVKSSLGTSVIELFSRSGRSRIARRRSGGVSEYRYDAVASDALGDWMDARLRGFVASGWHSADEWLEASAASPYPDLVVQMTEMFDSPRAGDLVLFAADGWDFRRGDRGGHGGVLRAEVRIPMIFIGPGIRKGETLPVARLTDVVPTVLHLIRGHGSVAGENDFDGVDRAPWLLSENPVEPLYGEVEPNNGARTR